MPCHATAVLAAATALFALTPATSAQRLGSTGLRFELGQRLRPMERALDLDRSPTQILRVLAPLEGAVQDYFRGDVPAVARALVRARWLVESGREPTPRELALGSLCWLPSARLLEAGTRELDVSAVALYPVESRDQDPERASDDVLDLGAATFSLTPRGGGEAIELGPPHALALDNLPVTWTVPLPELSDGDYDLCVQFEDHPASQPVTIALARDLEQRLGALDTAASATPRGERSSTAETLLHTLRLLGRLRTDDGDETNHPGHRLLVQAEAMAAAEAGGTAWFGPETSGDLRVRLATPNGLVVARLMVPEGLDADSPTPLVIALHGAGGSENLFFDGYGDGLGPRLARDRGWLFLAPRTNTRPQALAAVIDELARYYPVDTTRVFLVGHSMGAMATASAFQFAPERYRAIALLGGGGAVRDRDAFGEVPVLVAVGDKDFLRSSAVSFSRTLDRLGAKNVRLLEYPDVEHMAVVQLALRDVFEHFARAGS